MSLANLRAPKLNETTLSAGIEHAKKHMQHAAEDLDTIDDETWPTESDRASAARDDIRYARDRLVLAIKCLDFVDAHLDEVAKR